MNNILRIKEIRILRKLTLDELAEKSGISKRMISAYEANENDITLKKLQNIATALDVGIDDLIKKESKDSKNGGKYFIEANILEDVANRMDYGENDPSALKLKIMQLETEVKVLSAVNDKLIQQLGSKSDS